MRITFVSADQEPPMFEVSGGITPRALASSNSLGTIVLTKLPQFKSKKFFFTCQGKDSLSRPPSLLSPGPKFETSPRVLIVKICLIRREHEIEEKIRMEDE